MLEIRADEILRVSNDTIEAKRSTGDGPHISSDALASRMGVIERPAGNLVCF